MSNTEIQVHQNEQRFQTPKHLLTLIMTKYNTYDNDVLELLLEYIQKSHHDEMTKSISSYFLNDKRLYKKDGKLTKRAITYIQENTPVTDYDCYELTQSKNQPYECFRFLKVTHLKPIINYEARYKNNFHKQNKLENNYRIRLLNNTIEMYDDYHNSDYIRYNYLLEKDKSYYYKENDFMNYEKQHIKFMRQLETEIVPQDFSNAPYSGYYVKQYMRVREQATNNQLTLRATQAGQSVIYNCFDYDNQVEKRINKIKKIQEKQEKEYQKGLIENLQICLKGF